MFAVQVLDAGVCVCGRVGGRWKCGCILTAQLNTEKATQRQIISPAVNQGGWLRNTKRGGREWRRGGRGRGEEGSIQRHRLQNYRHIYVINFRRLR